MAKRLRIPMVGDRPRVEPAPAPKPAEPTPPLTPVVASSSDEPDKDFNWDLYEQIMVSCLVVHSSVEGLVDMWKSNINMLDWAKKKAPNHWQRMRDAFAKRKSALTGV